MRDAFSFHDVAESDDEFSNGSLAVVSTHSTVSHLVVGRSKEPPKNLADRKQKKFSFCR